MDIVSQKTCPTCKIEKPISEFYPRGKSGYYCTYCKECMKQTSKTQKKRDRQESGVASEADVIQQMLANGIPALPGKALGHKWADVVAWGCILCECKASNLIDGQFNYTFSALQRNERIRGEFIILVSNWGDHTDYYIFPSKHPIFYKNGRLKTGLGWTPDRAPSGRKAPISDEERESYKNAWHLIETRRLEIVQQLREKKIIALPIAA